ncbi:MAG: hypothetical protein E6K53_10760 [Gammaproteobacteria bacterium]|nr:MAG: hypothetical protein E6K53_10760 [Gammaproteobacteria bacterium]
MNEIVAISVVADIGSHPGVHCILDTGSSIGVLHSDLTVGAGHVGVMNTQVANGRVAMPIVQIRQITVGSTSLSFVNFLQRDHSWFDASQRLPCVIGANFLNHFTVDFDGKAGRVRLYPQGTHIDDILGAPPPHGTHLDARVGEGNIRVNTMVGAIHTLSEIDTGWGHATPNRALLDALGFTPDDARIQLETRTGPSGKQITLRVSEIDQVRVGALLANKLKIEVGEADMSHIAAHRDPYLHVGSDLVRQHRLLIDYAHADVALIP